MAYFYLQGLGSTRKTFLYKTIYYYYQGLGKTVLYVASTRLVALLLPNGCTTYSLFKILVENLNEDSHCTICKNLEIGDLLKNVDLIILDKVSTQYKHTFECIYYLFIDLCNTNDDMLFGGMPIILSGDFAQTLPIVLRGL